jgi:uncharacterized protein YjbI with pentapeptide repeats
MLNKKLILILAILTGNITLNYGSDYSEVDRNISKLLRTDECNDCYLYGADLSHANLTGADLIAANLRFANLRFANLNDADLNDANLSHANLIDADLTNADLIGANLRFANLRFANLTDADLTDADLIGAKNLDKAIYKKCSWNPFKRELNKAGKTSEELAKLIMAGRTICQK